MCVCVYVCVVQDPQQEDGGESERAVHEAVRGWHPQGQDARTDLLRLQPGSGAPHGRRHSGRLRRRQLARRHSQLLLLLTQQR